MDKAGSHGLPILKVQVLSGTLICSNNSNGQNNCLLSSKLGVQFPLGTLIGEFMTTLIDNISKEDLTKICKNSRSLSEILRNIGYASHGGSNTRKDLKSKLKEYNISIRKTSVYSYDEVTFKDAVTKSLCLSDICRYLNIKPITGNFITIKNYCKKLGVSLDHLNVKATFQRGRNSWKFEEIFCKNSKYPRTALRRAVFRFKVLPIRICKCGNIGIWEDKELILELDHINGISNDNRVENLRWICPNCHSQTETYRRKTLGS